ncbi:germination protein GerPC [Bacillus coahuilensis]|uniref:germination protein GerPC n=1 Tax=Bacillus coahuilensis TaxID=408580 RepID=UPI0001850BC0|nr:germination protein GerPC [Bacillus coahuilensis]
MENLDGTLNIGLNPGDAKSIEELAVNQAGNPLQSIPVDQLREPLIKDMQDFLANHLDSIIQDNETQLQRSLDAPYYTHIKEDLLKQIPERVNFYLETFPVGALEQNNPDGAFNKILSKLKK